VTQTGYVFLGLSALVAMLIATLTFAVLRFAAAARDTRRHLREGGAAETALLTAALQDAVARLKTQEQVMSARAVASEQLSAQIVESLTAGLLLVDGDGRVEILNPAARRMLDLEGEVAERDFGELLAVAPPLVEAIAECLATAEPIVRRSLNMPPGLRVTHLGVTVSPLGADAKRGAICLFSDLTSIVELEDQLRLKETLARLGELTAGIAHEFRNGLATIHGYSRLIDPQALPEQYRPYVEGIRQETEALRQVVTNFLRFARPEQVVRTRLDLGAVVRRAVDDLEHELPTGASVEVTGTYAAIDGDEVLLRQVFGNLVRNAVDACEDAHITPAIAIGGSIDERQHVVRVTVDDNGPGVPERARDQIFQPFFTTRSRGTGLGLAIVQKIVVLHNGRVSVRGSAQGGASFQIVFPLAARESVVRPFIRAAARSRGPTT
jgi:signal transduction histidine kinase